MHKRFSENRSLTDNFILFCVFFALVFLTYRFGQWMTIQERIRSTSVGQLEYTKEPWIETISWKPRLSVYHNILTEEECDYIVDLVGKEVNKESVVKSIEGVFLPSIYKEDEVIQKLTKKLSEWTQLPVENGEDYYLWKYKEFDEYPPHRDTIIKPENMAGAGERLASVYVYLNTPQGGDLIFTEVNPPIAIKPIKGNAVLLWNLKPNGEEDIYGTHKVVPITQGIKWTLTKWIRQKKFQ